MGGVLGAFRARFRLCWNSSSFCGMALLTRIVRLRVRSRNEILPWFIRLQCTVTRAFGPTIATRTLEDWTLAISTPSAMSKLSVVPFCWRHES